MKNNLKKYTYIFSVLIATTLTSCDNMLEAEIPSNQLSSSTVYMADETAEAAVNGIYQSLLTSTYNGTIHSILGQTSDELVPQTLATNLYSTNEIPVNDSNINSMWGDYYKTIYNANAVIEGINGSTTLTDSSAKRWIAEAKFLRAYCHFCLVNIWGDVPLILTTNVDVTALAPRTAKDKVYEQIISDLNDAIANLPTDYSKYSTQRIRATKWAAHALLARVDLYLEKWSDAVTNATAVIDQTGTYKLIQGLTSTNSPFIADNKEAIWQVPYFSTTYTYEGSVVFTTGNLYWLRKSSTLFETGDARKTNWTIATTNSNYIAPRKYKNTYSTGPSERSTVLRLAELYLIRAEARAKLNDLDGAKADINVIRNRALLASTTISDQSGLLNLIALERQRELFAEFGQRWFDLKRSGTIDQVLGALTDKKWTTTDSLYPIPDTALRSNPFLTQNLGY